MGSKLATKLVIFDFTVKTTSAQVVNQNIKPVFLSAGPLIYHWLLTTPIEISLADIFTLKVTPLFTPLAGP